MNVPGVFLFLLTTGVYVTLSVLSILEMNKLIALRNKGTPDEYDSYSYSINTLIFQVFCLTLVEVLSLVHLFFNLDRTYCAITEDIIDDNELFENRYLCTSVSNYDSFSLYND